MTPGLRAACEDALHVFQTDGTVLSGADAVLFVYEQLGWRVAGVGRSAPVLPLMEAGYRVVARNRMLFSRVFFRKDRER